MVRFPSSDGIDPVSTLFWSCSCVRLVRFPRSDGIDPVRLLLAMARCVRLVRFPNSGGSVPFSGSGEVAPRMRIAMTRSGAPDKLIPVQLDIGVVAFQFSVAVPRRVSFNPHRTLQSAMRPVFV